MAAEPTLEPAIAREEEQEEIDEGEESDVYEIEVLSCSLLHNPVTNPSWPLALQGEEEGDSYEPDEDEDEDGDEGVREGEPDNVGLWLSPKK